MNNIVKDSENFKIDIINDINPITNKFNHFMVCGYSSYTGGCINNRKILGLYDNIYDAITRQIKLCKNIDNEFKIDKFNKTVIKSPDEKIITYILFLKSGDFVTEYNTPFSIELNALYNN